MCACVWHSAGSPPRGDPIFKLGLRFTLQWEDCVLSPLSWTDLFVWGGNYRPSHAIFLWVKISASFPLLLLLLLFNHHTPSTNLLYQFVKLRGLTHLIYPHYYVFAMRENGVRTRSLSLSLLPCTAHEECVKKCSLRWVHFFLSNSCFGERRSLPPLLIISNPSLSPPPPPCTKKCWMGNQPPPPPPPYLGSELGLPALLSS